MSTSLACLLVGHVFKCIESLGGAGLSFHVLLTGGFQAQAPLQPVCCWDLATCIENLGGAGFVLSRTLDRVEKAASLLTSQLTSLVALR